MRRFALLFVVACGTPAQTQTPAPVTSATPEPIENPTATPLSSPMQVTPSPQSPAVLTSTERCTKDAECVVSNFASCCDPCRATAYATSQKELEPRTRRCAIVDCAAPPKTMTCPPMVDALEYDAKCRAGTCAGFRRRAE